MLSAASGFIKDGYSTSQIQKVNAIKYQKYNTIGAHSSKVTDRQ